MSKAIESLQAAQEHAMTIRLKVGGFLRVAGDSPEAPHKRI